MIQPEYRRFIDIISGKLFRIPEYQRHYSWQKKQRDDLFMDIRNLEKALKNKQDREHFMSTIVCLQSSETETIGSDTYRYYDVVDGQQRLTTLIILLKAISKILKDRNPEEARSLDELLVKKDGKSIILQNNHDNIGILKNYLQGGDKPKENDIKTAADANLLECIKDCEEFLKHYKSTNDLIHLLSLIKNKLCFVFQQLSDAGSVYTVFEVLNSRGLDVDWLDKCKSKLMGMLYEAKAASGGFEQSLKGIHKYWIEIYGEIGTQDIEGQEVVRFAATLRSADEKGRPLSAEDAIEYFQEYCLKGKDNDEIAKRVEDATEWIRKVTKALSKLYADKRRDAVTEILQARLLATSILLADLSDEDRKKALEVWEKVTFRIYGLYGADARVKVGDFVRLAKEVQKSKLHADEICKKISEIGKDYPIDNIPSAVLNDPYDELGPAYLRYLFYRYEENLCEKNGAQLDEATWENIWKANANDTIEHILPQKIEGKDCWSEFEDKKGYAQKLGNLVILSPSDNAKASNKCFNEKKEIYSSVALRSLRGIVGKAQWTMKEIDDRTKELHEFIKKTWG